jgi:CyaY protein
MATPTPAARMADPDFHARAEAVFANVESTIDRWLEDDEIDIDTHRTGGLLELEFPDRSKIVLNTQPPLQELWLAAASGGFHFRWLAGRWLDTRGDGEFFETLSRCASAQAGKALTFASGD